MNIKRAFLLNGLTILTILSACSNNNDITSIKQLDTNIKQTNTENKLSSALPLINKNDDSIELKEHRILGYQPKGVNLIPNYDFKIVDHDSKIPENWHHDSWGEANVKFDFLEDETKSKFLSISVSDYVDSGDSKWFFEPQNLKSGEWYLYSDESRSDGRSRMIVSYEDIESKKRHYSTVWQSDQSSVWHEDGFSFYLSPELNNNITIFHALDRNGKLDIKKPSLKNIVSEPLAKPFISIAFDDIYSTAVTHGALELEKRGLKGSFYIVKDFIQNPKDQYANEDMIHSLYKEGHEIGSHSKSHRFLSTLDDTEIEKDLKENIDYIASLGIKTKGLAYPYGDFSEKAENQSVKLHQYTRTSLEGLNDKLFDTKRLKIISVTSETSTEKLMQIIDDTNRNSVWAIFLFHDLGENDPTNIYRTPLTQYTEILDYIKKKNITTLPVNEVLDQIK